jgi:membrane complex biogenesis BtpA family protein
MEFREIFPKKPVLGMIHMPALPGAPKNKLGMKELVEFAQSEAAKLEAAGIDGAIVENVGDSPFFRTHVPPMTVAAMANIVKEVRDHTEMKVGVNMLRNACEEAMAVAYISGADFIRCNVVIGAYVTDQGIIQGCAAKLARLRMGLRRDIVVLGDVHVKHAYPLFNVPIEDAARDLAERGGVDAVLVSGSRSPVPPSFETLKAVRDAIRLPVLIGSGIGLANAREFYRRSDGVLLGETDFKVGGVWGGASDGRAYAKAVKDCRR